MSIFPSTLCRLNRLNLGLPLGLDDLLAHSGGAGASNLKCGVG